MSKDGTTLLVTAPSGNNSPFLYEYNIAAKTWSTVNAPAAQAAAWANRTEASFLTDPNTGASYLLGGAFPDGTSTNEIDKFQDGTWTASLAPTPGAGTSSSTSFNNFNSGTAHLYGNKIFIFGGFSSTAGRRGYQSFQSLPWIDISTTPPTYGTQLTLGNVPQARQDHCSVLTTSQKVIIFGGYDANAKSTFADVWSLDMVTLTWSQTVTTNPTRPRYGHNCDIAGANMVVYGGMFEQQWNGPANSKDIQVYDVMLSTWMSSYAPKPDTTTISQPLPGTGSASGLGTGPIIGIVAGVLVIVGCIVGFFLYKRRQKQIEIREAEMEKEAYLASLRPEGGDQFGGGKSGHSQQSPNAARAAGASVISTPGMSHAGAYNGMDELLLSGAAASPGMGGQAQGNVQYLMQHLPDGTIAVQPVYLDHQPLPMQSSPNMVGTSADTNAAGGFVSPLMTGGTSGTGYFAPPPSGPGVASPTGGATTATSPYVLPPSMQQKSPVAYPQPTHDPFASPALPNAPLPPGYNPSVSASGLGSPQQMPEQLR
ncbi:hypothetical protein BGZ54_004976 [Gamsiella multidivaricata]|nr:hypothetical protein BGZ54_004976 [Gamsiella multidivaricata]